MVKPRLKNHHVHGADVVEKTVGLQSAQGVQHHLRVVLGLNLDTAAVLIVDDIQVVSADDDAVGRPKSFGDERG